jgi:hypothetical protein
MTALYVTLPVALVTYEASVLYIQASCLLSSYGFKIYGYVLLFKINLKIHIQSLWEIYFYPNENCSIINQVEMKR